MVSPSSKLALRAVCFPHLLRALGCAWGRLNIWMWWSIAGELGQNIYLVDVLTGTQMLDFRVTQHITDDSSIPTTLRPLPDIGVPTVTRNWSFNQAGGH